MNPRRIFRYVFLLVFLFSIVNCTIHSRISDLGSTSASENLTSEQLENPTSVTYMDLLSESVKVIWNQPNVSSTQFRLVIAVGNTVSIDCASSSGVDVSGTSYPFTGLQPETEYSVKICTAKNGNYSSGEIIHFKTFKNIILNAAYPASADWNDYILNNGTNLMNATGAACAGTTYYGCIHSGTIFKADLPASVTCSQISVSDYLDVFWWRCDSSGSPHKIYSVGLKDRKGLQDLLNPTEFKKNYIILRQSGTITHYSEPKSWWQNPVVPLPIATAGQYVSLTNGGSTAGKIFVVSESRSGGSYYIDENQVALVVLKNAVLTVDQPITESAFSVKLNLWMEGIYDGGNLAFVSPRFSRFHNIELRKGGFDFGVSTAVMIDHFRVFRGSRGVNLATGTNPIVTHGEVYGVANGNWATNTINLESSNGAIFSNTIFANSSSTGISTGPGTLVHNLSLVSLDRDVPTTGTSWAYRLNSWSNTHNALIINGGTTAIRLFSVNNAQLAQTMVSAASSYTFYAFSTASTMKVTKNFIIQTADCLLNTSSYPLGNGTCTNLGSSDATLTVGFDPTEIFVGTPATNDEANTSDALGTALFSGITDWYNFSNPYRAWGVQSTGFPSFTSRGPCTSGTCQIWDYRLKASSNNKAFNRTLTQSTQNQTFLANQTCPTAIHGNEITSYNDGTVTHTYLTNAEEIFDDGIGNNDSLCESGETCIYNPNIGAYQGEGDYLANGTCNFVDGTVTNVKMYSYPIIGI